MKSLYESILKSTKTGEEAFIGNSYEAHDISVAEKGKFAAVSWELLEEYFDTDKLSKFKPKYKVSFRHSHVKNTEILVNIFNVFLNTIDLPVDKLKDVLFQGYLKNGVVTSVERDDYSRSIIYNITVSDIVITFYLNKKKN